MRSGDGNARRLRIGIDAHAIGEKKTGNERFINNVARELLAVRAHDLVLYFTDATAAGDWRSGGAEVRVLRPRHPALRIPLALPIAARRDRLDVLLVQYTGPPLLHCPLVSVVHDVSFASHPEYFRASQRAWMRLTIPWTIRRADRVVTGSRFSSQEIRDRYGIGEDKVVIAYHAVDPKFGEPAAAEPSVQPPYFLAVGNLEPRKNLKTLIRAFELLRSRKPTIEERLVIVGQNVYHAGDIRSLGKPLEKSGAIVFTGYVDDANLIALIQGATALAYPSTYEGFGLPVLEAMAAGTPALVSDIPVMREVAGGAALHVAALDSTAWARALERIALDHSLRRQLIDAGRRRAGEFSWSRCAETIIEALESAVHERASSDADDRPPG